MRETRPDKVYVIGLHLCNVQNHAKLIYRDRWEDGNWIIWEEPWRTVQSHNGTPLGEDNTWSYVKYDRMIDHRSWITGGEKQIIEEHIK